MKLTNEEMAYKIASEVSKQNGCAYYVGGYVRDSILGIESKDIDIEVHGLEPDKIEMILDSLGSRIVIGESFGIYNLCGYNIDIALPRKEKQRGGKHTDFDISVDPYIGTYKACERRDFTINAMMKNILTGEIIDHFGGIDDIKNKVIRHVNDETFKEDALRVLRACQFASRFEYSIAPETKLICSQIDISQLSCERIFAELEKALLKSSKPSIFFELMREMNQLDVYFPELKALIGVIQSKKYHGEGDVWTHTMLVLDECAKFRDLTTSPIAFMLSGLVHDFGKAICTEVRDDGKITSYGHEIKGIPLVKDFLSRITNEKFIHRYATNMTKLHMRPNALAKLNAKIKSTNALFDESMAPKDLVYLSIADNYGRIVEGGIIDNSDFLFSRLKEYEDTMSLPYVSGDDLIKLGYTPNEHFKEYLDLAHKLRLNKTPKDDALKQVIQFIKYTERKKYGKEKM